MTTDRPRAVDRDCGCEIQDAATGHVLVSISSCVEECTFGDVP